MNIIEKYIARNEEEVLDKEEDLLERLTSGRASMSLIVDIVEGSEMGDLTIAIQRLLAQDKAVDTQIEGLLREVFMKSLRGYAAYTLQLAERTRLSAATSRPFVFIKGGA